MIYFSKDIYLRTAKAVVTSTKMNMNPGPLMFTEANFSFEFSLIHPVTYYPLYDPSIYRIEVINEQTIEGAAIGARQMSIERCSGHFQDIPGVFSEVGKESYHCMAKNESFVLQGTLSSSTNRYFKIRVYPCRNGTDPGVVCQSQEAINTLLDGTSMYFYFMNTLFDPKNYTSPTTYYSYTYMSTVNKNYFKPVLILKRKYCSKVISAFSLVMSRVSITLI
jgi:hypothetical protein